MVGCILNVYSLSIVENFRLFLKSISLLNCRFNPCCVKNTDFMMMDAEWKGLEHIKKCICSGLLPVFSWWFFFFFSLTICGWVSYFGKFPEQQVTMAGCWTCAIKTDCLCQCSDNLYVLLNLFLFLLCLEIQF